MKALLLLLLLPTQAMAVITSVRINAASTNIPTTFSTGSTSKVINAVKGMKTMLVDNRSGTEVAVNCQGLSGTAPSGSDAANVYVNALSAVAIDNSLPSGTCYIRSMGSTISSGVVVIMLSSGS